MSPKNEFISEARSVSFKDQARSEEDLVYFIQKNGKSGKEASASQFGKHREKRCVAKKEGLIPWECPISQSQFQFPFKKQYQNELFLGRNPSFSLLVLYLTRAEKTTQNKKKSIFKRFSYRLLSREQTAIVRLSILFFMAGLETSEEDHHLYPVPESKPTRSHRYFLFLFLIGVSAVYEALERRFIPRNQTIVPYRIRNLRLEVMQLEELASPGILFLGPSPYIRFS
ncbi:hypothetical protein IEQ34_024703 [Dendrobium chrysotoxum]|uniref:Uncharacterized protein n=1 Tax=Dendrobium chrysotoxum TaxID=161865 RepID=A0AAV7FSU3_DENCH|nr:hypothetical protein IEQ34_024703 [Dendrobium chrysotoxum]